MGTINIDYSLKEQFNDVNLYITYNSEVIKDLVVYDIENNEYHFSSYSPFHNFYITEEYLSGNYERMQALKFIDYVDFVNHGKYGGKITSCKWMENVDYKVCDGTHETLEEFNIEFKEVTTLTQPSNNQEVIDYHPLIVGLSFGFGIPF